VAVVSEPGDRLPLPDSPELQAIVAGREAREAYRFLYERRDDPPTMAEWRSHAASALGKANEQTDRRLRELRDNFVVRCVRHRRRSVYLLEARKVNQSDQQISPRLEVEVYTTKGRRCQMCGLGPADGMKLQIDHIIPRAWGGLSVLENLEPLCERHNHGKQAFFATYDEHGHAIRRAMAEPDVWRRIGELLKAFSAQGLDVPSDLVALVAGQYNRGDPARRLRELRTALGWVIHSRKYKEDGRTKTRYRLERWQPWPPEGPRQVVNRHERERKRRRESGGSS
jgi:5-methylcytosine-specific restriction endonuclease McrA